MVTLESCKGCGCSKFDVKRKEGLRFLVCTHCGNDVALLDDKEPPKIGGPYIPYTGWGDPFSMRIMASGMCYSGMIIPETVIYSGY